MENETSSKNLTEEFKPPVCRTVLEYMLYKIDRTLAIAGLIAIGIFAILSTKIPDASVKVLSSVVTGLSMYLGVRLGSK